MGCITRLVIIHCLNENNLTKETSLRFLIDLQQKLLNSKDFGIEFRVYFIRSLKLKGMLKCVNIYPSLYINK